jgi:minichromosome maintenance protein 10
LSTPGGRDRLRRLAERASPSPSPSKRERFTPSARSKAQDLLKDEMDDEDEDDDEETLQLQLQEIQARLKLKKLQKRTKQSSDNESETKRQPASISRSNSVVTNRVQSRLAEQRAERLVRSKSQTEINVPVSPIRRTQPTPIERSPGRVLLGIDKGLKGSDISLRRAPSLRRRDDSNSQDRITGPYLHRPVSQYSSRANGIVASSQSSSGEDRPKTFSERMAAIRSQETERQERESRIKKNRSTAFDIDHEQMKSFKDNATVIPEGRRRTPEFSREEVMSSYTKLTSNVTLSKLDSTTRTVARNTSNSTHSSVSERSDSRSGLKVPARKRSTISLAPPAEIPESEATQFEPYSSQHLSRRIIPHQVLTRTLSGKKPFLIPDLLKTVKGPDFSPPDIEEDLVVFGIIASKSDPKAHQPNANPRGQKRGKFMVMTMTDLKWELDLFLFDSAFEKFWKLTTGTIIAILNPQIMPPARGREATGKFSLTLNSDGDTILEVGTARDLGFCKSIKKDGKTCSTWVDKRHTEFCDYHVNEQLKKTHASRMEVNTMNFGKGGGYGARRYISKDSTGHPENVKKAEEQKRTRYDVGSHSQIYIGKKSTASLLDDVDFDPDAFHRGSTKEERMTRRVLAQEKERELERKLGDLGNGAGANYAAARNRRNDSSRTAPHPSNPFPPEAPPDASALGLLGGKASDVALSPIKRKRVNKVSSSEAMGWGTNLSKELGRMKDGDNLSIGSSRPPVKKKTRFVTEKGIREAGRESFGGEVVGVSMVALGEDDDDDDDLDIVRE